MIYEKVKILQNDTIQWRGRVFEKTALKLFGF